MKKFLFGLFLCLVMIGFFCCGFFVRDMISTEFNDEKESSSKINVTEQQVIQPNLESVIGIYHTANWNGGAATLMLNADGTCKHPLGMMGTYRCEDDKIFLTFGNEGNSATHIAYLVTDGIILQDRFLEKK